MNKDVVPIDIIFVLNNEWSFHDRPLERYTELAKGVAPFQGKILIINRPLFLISKLPLQPLRFLKQLKQRKHLKQIWENCFVYTPFLLVHDILAVRNRNLIRINNRLLYIQIQRVLQKLGFKSRERIAWILDPFLFYYTGALRPTVTIYECIDQHAAKTNQRWKKEKIKAIERNICEQANLIFCTASNLCHEKKQFNRETYFVPNAADLTLLSLAQDSRTPIAKVMLDVPHPIIGYLGTIHKHTDIALMKYAAENRPEWTFVIIGPEQDKRFSRSKLFTDFRKLPNVVLTGWLKREELPGYCKAFDVAVIPYRMDSEFNQYVNPDKLHEYAAMGKPIVSTDIPEVRSYQEIVKIANTPAAFVHAIEESMAEDNPARVQERLTKARENSWSARSVQCLARVQELIRAREVLREDKFDLLVYLSSDWKNYHRKQMLLTLSDHMKGKGKVLCVERPLSVFTSPFSNFRKTREFLIGPRGMKHETDNLFIYTPLTLAHDFISWKIPGMPAANRAMLSFELRKIVRKLALDQRRLLSWVYHPLQADYIGLVDGIGYVYECYDDYYELANANYLKERIRKTEKNLVEKAAVVFTTALKLFNIHKATNSNTFHIANAVNLPLFQAYEKSGQIPDDLRLIPGPRIGFVGKVDDDFVDCEMIEQAALRNPTWSFIFIGPVNDTPPVVRLKEIPNLFFLGVKPYELLPQYIKHFDCGVIPLKLNKITESLNPLKLYEYMAAGCPIVSTDVPEIRIHARYVSIAKNIDEFIGALRRLITEDSEQLRLSLREEAKLHSWDVRVNDMIRIIETTVLSAQRNRECVPRLSEAVS